MKKRKIAFYIPEQLYLLNLAGPLQVFQEAIDFGANFKLLFISNNERLAVSAGFELSSLVRYSDIVLAKGDYLIVCGKNANTAEDHEFLGWLKSIYELGVKVSSICVGAFSLGQAGLLDNKRCTTHWKYTEALQKSFPKATVVRDQIYVKDANLYTSAGVASGIDLALWIIEEEYDSKFVFKIARELVIYFRRDGSFTQKSIYLDYRNHMQTGIHEVQDFLLNNIHKKTTLTELADLANMSVRNLTRVFKKSTGISIKRFMTKVRLEKAENLLRNTNLKIDAISSECGFEDTTQLRRIWYTHFKKSPSQFREST